MFNLCNTLVAQFRLIRFGSILVTIHMMYAQILNSMWRMDHVLFKSRIRINIDCHVLRVEACIVCSFSTEPESVVQLYSATLS
jgi:hypothetical protein